MIIHNWPKARAVIGLLAGLHLAGCATPPPAVEKTTSQCVANPIGNRSLFARGTFNNWAANDAHQFRYVCNQFSLVTKLSGSHAFKIADDDWSKDADFGGTSFALNTELELKPTGREFKSTFEGYYKLTLNMATNKPTLTVEACATPPLGDTTLFLRGSMNNWTALDEYAFDYQCDGYQLNVSLSSAQEFKIGDAVWSPNTTYGAANGPMALTLGKTISTAREADASTLHNLQFSFAGEQTIKITFGDQKHPRLTITPNHEAALAAARITDPIAKSLTHDTRALADKAPFGAVTAGSTIAVQLSALPGVSRATMVVERRKLEGNQEVLGYTEIARVPMVVDSHRATGLTTGPTTWRASTGFSDIGIYGYYFEIEIGETKYLYQNNATSVYWTRERGNGGVGIVTEPVANKARIRRFRQTVYDKNFTVPAWARDAVYYYIFPDRFRNGNKGNDQKPGVTTYQDKAVEFHTNWHDKPYRPNSGDGSDAVYNNDFFGGDLAGIIEKLDYIKSVGANTIYMTPVFKAASNHKYDTADYKNIDPHFGGNDDFIKLTKEAASRGIRVIPDTSLNHVGSDSIYFDRYAKHGTKGAFLNARVAADSPYADWFRFDTTATEPDKQYKGWVGVLDLPEINKSSPSFRKFAYGDKDSVTKLWLDRGAAGWRMDVVPWVPDDFWREWRAAVKSHKPDAITIAETWFDSSKFFLGDTFDSTMNYIFRNTVLDYANGGKANVLYQNIEWIREAYPPQAFYALMNLVSSHDQARALHLFGYKEGATPEDISRAKQRLKLATFFQMTFPGAPAIYYGDEVGVTGGDDPYNRATYPWADLGGKPDTALLAEFQAMTKMRRDHAVLRHGTISAPIYSDANVIVLTRRLENSFALVATNNAVTAKTVRVTLPDGVRDITLTEALTGAAIRVEGNTFTLNVPPVFGVVLVGRVGG